MLTGGVASPGVFFQAFQADRFHIAWNRRIQSPGRCWIILDHLVHRVPGRVCAKRRTSDDQVVQDRAQCIEIGSGPQLISATERLFRRHERRGTHHLARLGHSRIGLNLASQAKIGDPGLHCLGHQDVGRFKIAVQNSVFVSVVHCQRQRTHDPADGFDRQSLVPAKIGQVSSIDKPHREVVIPIVFTGIKNGNDIGMVQFGNRFCFGVKPLDFLFVGKLACQNHLQGDDAFGGFLLRAENDAHSSTGNLFDQFIGAKIRADAGNPPIGFSTGSNRRLRFFTQISSCGVIHQRHQVGPHL